MRYKCSRYLQIWVRNFRLAKAQIHIFSRKWNALWQRRLRRTWRISSRKNNRRIQSEMDRPHQQLERSKRDSKSGENLIDKVARRPRNAFRWVNDFRTEDIYHCLTCHQTIWIPWPDSSLDFIWNGSELVCVRENSVHLPWLAWWRRWFNGHSCWLWRSHNDVRFRKWTQLHADIGSFQGRRLRPWSWR